MFTLGVSLSLNKSPKISSTFYSVFKYPNTTIWAILVLHRVFYSILVFLALF